MKGGNRHRTFRDNYKEKDEEPEVEECENVEIEDKSSKIKQ